jgi:hypothetical protein
VALPFFESEKRKLEKATWEPNLLLLEARALFKSKSRQRRAARERDAILWLCERINNFPYHALGGSLRVKLRNDDASVLRFTLLAALSKMIEEVGIANRISQLTPVVQCVSQDFRSNKLELVKIELASTVAYQLLVAEAHGMDVMFAQALNCFPRKNSRQ